MLKKLQLVILCLFCVLIVPVKKLYAIDIFSDDFDAQNEKFWKYQSNGGVITYLNGVMSLSSSVFRFPFVTGSEIKKVRDYSEATIEFKFNYASVGYMGNGIGVGYSGANDYPYYQFSIWNDLNMGPVFQYRDAKVSLDGLCDYSNVTLLKKSIMTDINDKKWHIFRIVKRGNSYVVSIDSEHIYTTLGDQCVPENVFIGNPLSGGRKDWNLLNVDYFKLYFLLPRNKIIIIPGLGASWNPQAILNNSTIPANQWTMTPFVKNYDLLIGALENNGLVKGQDFYVWNYDWRKPLSVIVEDFNNFISILNLQSGQKINLVGHSLGGLVARLWTQDHPEIVEKTITLGSPHYGAVRAYEAWNGAKISDNFFDISSIGLNVLLQLQKKNNDSSVQTLRSYAPIVFDLSPTFTFLKRNGNVITDKYSQYLSNKNTDVSIINDKLSTVDGKGVNTSEWINLGDRSLFDKVLGIWEDGRPLSYLYGEGDGTVLKKSALILGNENAEFTSDHGELVDKSTNWILAKLGLGTTINLTRNYPKKQAIFYSDSQALMNVNCGGTERNENSGWIVVEGQDSKNCQVNLVGKNGGGNYRLAVGGNDNWQYFEGNLADNQTKYIVLNSVDVYWQVLKQDFINLNLSVGFTAIDQKNILATIDEYIKFRQLSKNYKYSEEILENIKFILNNRVYSLTEINNMYTKALANKSLVETNLRLMSRNGLTPKYSDAMNYEQANILMSNGKNYAANYLANKLYGIVWK